MTDTSTISERSTTNVEQIPATGVVVLIDGERMPLTREQEALIRAWAAGPV